MRVYISKYRYHWVSPYTICEKICFWREIDYDEPWVKFMNRILEPVSTLWRNFLDIVHPRIEYVKIDPCDTWDMRSTLGVIILPMLKDIQKARCGAPCTDDKDVPKHLRSTSAKPKENSWDTDEFHFARWEWIIGEMVWAFENVVNEDWEDQFFKAGKYNKKGYKQYSDRIEKGLILFGKYYRGLWT